jgi:hypothetical protein
MDKHPFEERQSAQDYFRTIMHTVVGQAFAAAGYELLHEPMKWTGGRFRYAKPLANGLTGYIEFQVLVYNDTAYTGKQASRFTVTLYRTDQTGGRQSKHPQYVQRSLSQLVVTDFGVEILPDADYWWQFKDTDALGKALAEAGHLIIGYAIPYLAGDLLPDAE